MYCDLDANMWWLLSVVRFTVYVCVLGVMSLCLGIVQSVNTMDARLYHACTTRKWVSGGYLVLCIPRLCVF